MIDRHKNTYVYKYRVDTRVKQKTRTAAESSSCRQLTVLVYTETINTIIALRTTKTTKTIFIVLSGF